MAGGLNAYGFASGDPVNYSDPFGLCPNQLAPGFGSLECFFDDFKSFVEAKVSSAFSHFDVEASHDAGVQSFSWSARDPKNVDMTTKAQFPMLGVSAGVRYNHAEARKGALKFNQPVGVSKHLGLNFNFAKDTGGLQFLSVELNAGLTTPNPFPSVDLFTIKVPSGKVEAPNPCAVVGVGCPNH